MLMVETRQGAHGHWIIKKSPYIDSSTFEPDRLSDEIRERCVSIRNVGNMLVRTMDLNAQTMIITLCLHCASILRCKIRRMFLRGMLHSVCMYSIFCNPLIMSRLYIHTYTCWSSYTGGYSSTLSFRPHLEHGVRTPFSYIHTANIDPNSRQKTPRFEVAMH
ncbi:hypothetical protein F4776DRAFT_627709 [Hypoxylon sp. NC0597]|nr:hypothetical protein F4776DRAFT_627709 [Hypoxylon sp. NC0597]